MIKNRKKRGKTENNEPELSVILPCRNEEKTLEYCIKQIKSVLKENKIKGEIIVSDSSTDKSAEIARKEKVRLIKHNKEGYGIAYLEGFKKASGKYIFMADADGTYDFKEIPRFLNYLKGYDFVIGNRFKGRIEKGAMSFLHRMGNFILSLIFRIFFRARINDVHCGMRAITKKSLDKLELKTTGMEFASEMVIKAIKKRLKIKELNINYYKRKGSSKLRSFSDGWKHLRFMLLYSPTFLFFIPGLILFFLGLISMLWVYLGPPEIFGIKLFYHPMFLSALLIIIAYQLIIFGLFAKTYVVTNLGEENFIINAVNKYVTIEKAGIAGLIICLLGLIILTTIFSKWVSSGFGELQEVKKSIIALTLLFIGVQTIFSSFMLSILGIKK